MRGRSCCADSGLAAHKLCVETISVDRGPRAAVQDRKQPYADESNGHREKRRIVKPDRRRPLGKAKGHFPHGGRQYDANHGTCQTKEAPNQCAPRSETLPED